MSESRPIRLHEVVTYAPLFMCCGPGPRNRYGEDDVFLLSLSYKVCLDGPSGSGKTSVARFFCERIFDDSTLPLKLLYTKTVSIENEEHTIQIWDPHQNSLPQYRQHPPILYRNAKGVLFIFDVTKESSFNELKDIIANVTQHLPEGTIKYLIGNKMDLINDLSALDTGLWNEYALENGMILKLVSGKTGENIQECFISLTNEIVNKFS